MSIRIVFKDNLHFVTLSALLLTFRRYRKDMAQLGIFLRLTGKKYFPNWGKSFSQLGNFQGALWGCLSKGLGKLSLCQRKKCFRRQKVTLCNVPNNRDLGLKSFSVLNRQIFTFESGERSWALHLKCPPSFICIWQGLLHIHTPGKWRIVKWLQIIYDMYKTSPMLIVCICSF